MIHRIFIYALNRHFAASGASITAIEQSSKGQEIAITFSGSDNQVRSMMNDLTDSIIMHRPNWDLADPELTRTNFFSVNQDNTHTVFLRGKNKVKGFESLLKSCSVYCSRNEWFLVNELLELNSDQNMIHIHTNRHLENNFTFRECYNLKHYFNNYSKFNIQASSQKSSTSGFMPSGGPHGHDFTFTSTDNLHKALSNVKSDFETRLGRPIKELINILISTLPTSAGISLCLCRSEAEKIELFFNYTKLELGLFCYMHPNTLTQNWIYFNKKRSELEDILKKVKDEFDNEEAQELFSDIKNAANTF